MAILKMSKKKLNNLKLSDPLFALWNGSNSSKLKSIIVRCVVAIDGLPMRIDNESTGNKVDGTMTFSFKPALCAGGLALGTLLAFGPAANAASVTVDLDYEFSGAANPSSPLKVTINESAPDTLTYTLDASALTASEHVKEFYFNLDPFLTPLTWDLTDTTAAWSSYGEGLDTFKADGDGFFDYRLVFDSSNAGNRLKGTEVYSFSITGTGLDITDIVSKSTASGNAKVIGGFYLAAHVGGIADVTGAPSLSGWITCNHWDANGGCAGGPTPRSDPPPPPNGVPVPASLPLLLTALGAAAFLRRRAKASA
jgi:hypothetical protein